MMAWCGDMDKYNTFWNRLIAAIIDSLVLWPLAFINGYLEDSADRIVFTIGELVLSAIYLSYFIILHAKYGQTVGKKIMHIKVVDINETSLLGVRKATIRELPWLLANLVLIGNLFTTVFLVRQANLPQARDMYNSLTSDVAYSWMLIELITMLTNYKRRAVHDYLAKSVVIKTVG